MGAATGFSHYDDSLLLITSYLYYCVNKDNTVNSEFAPLSVVYISFDISIVWVIPD